MLAQTFVAGARVELDGLLKKPELNSRCGKITAYDPALGRYTVVLERVSGKLECPTGHKLREFKAGENGSCSSCALEFKTGAHSYGCSTCEYIMCTDCTSIKRVGLAAETYKLRPENLWNFGDKSRRNGRTDHSDTGIRLFFDTHQCNAVCRMLKLKDRDDFKID